MSIVTLDAESTIYHIVESMLPRCSDSKLALLMGINMHIADHGYGIDGNTRERKSKDSRSLFYFLFQRPSNYTKVFIWIPDDCEVTEGWDCNPQYSTNTSWELLSDHDSCWRDGFASKMTDIYFRASKKFDGRKLGDRPLRPCDLYQFITFWQEPSYMQLDVFEQKDKRAERFTTEGREWSIQLHSTSFAKLEMIESPDTKQMGSSGLLIKGSEDHLRYCKSAKLYQVIKNPPDKDTV